MNTPNKTMIHNTELAKIGAKAVVAINVLAQALKQKAIMELMNSGDPKTVIAAEVMEQTQMVVQTILLQEFGFSPEEMAKLCNETTDSFMAEIENLKYAKK